METGASCPRHTCANLKNSCLLDRVYTDRAAVDIQISYFTKRFTDA